MIAKIGLMDFAEWLKINREREKVSLRRLADKIGNLCSDAYLSQLENRRYKSKKGELMRPAKEIVVALAEALHANTDEALRLADYAPEGDTSAAAVPPPILEALAREGRLSPNDEVLIADFITRLKQTEPESVRKSKLEPIEDGEYVVTRLEEIGGKAKPKKKAS